MCGICGVIFHRSSSVDNAIYLVKEGLAPIIEATSVRGKDSVGFSILYENYYIQTHRELNKDKVWSPQQGQVIASKIIHYLKLSPTKVCSIIVHFRAEPTTERITLPNSETVQPLFLPHYGSLIHNGTIPNDVEIIESTPLKEEIHKAALSNSQGNKILDSWALFPDLLDFDVWRGIGDTRLSLSRIQGSYALAYQSQCTNNTILARNYRALSVARTTLAEGVDYFASKKEFLQTQVKCGYIIEDLPPYSYRVYDHFESKIYDGLIPDISGEYGDRSKVAVVCSGGLDSTTAATLACLENEEVTLLHFKYGCKAEGAEVNSIINISESLSEKFNKKVNYEFIDLSFLKTLGGSVLTEEHRHSEIATGDEGVETHNAWVPARNLVMMSLAAAYCDRHKLGKIYLGTNLEEAASFPDNTSSFTDTLNDCLQFGTVSRPEIVAPLRYCMKKDIVKKAIEIQAPIHLSHSCYHRQVCDIIETECGPCRMRRIALEEAGVTLDTFKQFYD